MKRVVEAYPNEVIRLLASGECGEFSHAELEVFNRAVLSTSKVWLGYIDGKLLCVYGLMPPTLCSDCAYLWLHTTAAMKEHVFVFIRQSQIAVERMLAEYPVIIGECKIGEARSIRWLKWLGAKFGHPGEKMIPFTITAKEPING